VASHPGSNISASNPDVQTSHVPDRADARRASGLVERAREGDREAFGELYRLCYAPLYRAARFRLGEGADDAVAETFLRAWTGLPRYRDTGRPFVAWLYGIERHVILDELARRRRVQSVGEPADEATETGLVDRLNLAAAMDELPEPHRQVLELKFLLGLSNAEVASAMGRTPGAVNAMQWRALGELRLIMRDR
jgi:RNA polymerase sigma-70 factor (ECF subfamily)